MGDDDSDSDEDEADRWDLEPLGEDRLNEFPGSVRVDLEGEISSSVGEGDGD